MAITPNNIGSLAGGLAEGINSYMQGNIQQQRQQQNMQAQTQAQTQQKEQLTNFSNQQSQVTPDMAEQMIPGSSKWVNGFQQQNGRLPTIDEVTTGLQSVVDKLNASNKSNNQDQKTQQQALQKGQSSYLSSIKTEQSAMDAANTAEDQVHLAISNPVAYSSVPVTLARMMTGSSRINQQEITRLGGNQAIMAKADQFATQMGSGTVTPENASWMEDLVNTIKTSHQQNIEDIGVQHASMLRRITKQDLPSAYQDVTGQPIPQRYTQTPTQRVTGTANSLEAKKAALRAKLNLPSIQQSNPGDLTAAGNSPQQ